MLVNYLYLFIAATVASAAYVSKDAPKVITLPLEHQSGVIQKRDGSAFSNDLDAYGTTIFTTIYVGSNEDRVKLQIDTGSWLTHIIDTQGICDHCDGNGRYNSSASTTVQRLGKPYASYFRPGDYYKGESVIDIVNFGGVKFPFNFDDSTNSSGSINGLLGLARPPTNENQSFVFQAKKAGVIDKAAFSFITSNLDDSEGSLILGGYDAAKIDGDIHWTSIKHSNIHAFINSVKINGTTIPVGRNATVDTGYSIGSLPQDVYEKFVAELPKDPNNPDPLKSLALDCSLFEGRTFTYTLNGVDYEFPLKALSTPKAKGKHCRFVVHPGNTPQLGAVLFRYLFVAVDWENELIGFASIKNTTETDIRAF